MSKNRFDNIMGKGLEILKRMGPQRASKMSQNRDIYLVRHEIINENDFAVEIRRDKRFDAYCIQRGIPLIPETFVLGPGKRQLFSNKYYSVVATNGAPFVSLKELYGRAIGQKQFTGL